MVNNERNSIDFDPHKEANFLAELSIEVDRLDVLRREVSTAITERLVLQGSRKFRLVDGKITDLESGKQIGDIVVNGGNQAEIGAFNTIESMVTDSESGEMMVHFSPANKILGYSLNVVDVWYKREGDEVTLLRFFVDEDFSQMKATYRTLGGESVESKTEMLAKPIKVDDLNLGQILSLLNLKLPKTNLNQSDVEEKVKYLLNYFLTVYRQEQMTSDPELIQRFFLAAWDNVAKSDNGVSDDLRSSQAIDGMTLWMYALAPMVVRQTKVMSGCSGLGLKAEFMGTGKGWIIVAGDTGLRFVLGETTGLKFCERCGCWHSGSKCPLCD